MRISLEVTYTVNDDDDWLSCRFGDYLTEPAYYQKGSKDLDRWLPIPAAAHLIPSGSESMSQIISQEQ